jgi:hypothetical protein
MLERIEKEFFRSLDKKTGWGKEEVKREFSKAVTNILLLTYSKVMKEAGKGSSDER